MQPHNFKLLYSVKTAFYFEVLKMRWSEDNSRTQQFELAPFFSRIQGNELDAL